MVDESLVQDAHATWMREGFRKQRVYQCPDHPTAGIGHYRRKNS
jgi:hypothetical protein